MPIHFERGAESWFQSDIHCKSKIILVYYSALFVCLLIYVPIYLSEIHPMYPLLDRFLPEVAWIIDIYPI